MKNEEFSGNKQKPVCQKYILLGEGKPKEALFSLLVILARKVYLVIFNNFHNHLTFDLPFV